jgi:hypothetical protein
MTVLTAGSLHLACMIMGLPQSQALRCLLRLHLVTPAPATLQHSCCWLLLNPYGASSTAVPR